MTTMTTTTTTTDTGPNDDALTTKTTRDATIQSHHRYQKEPRLQIHHNQKYEGGWCYVTRLNDMVRPLGARDAIDLTPRATCTATNAGRGFGMLSDATQSKETLGQ